MEGHLQISGQALADGSIPMLYTPKGKGKGKGKGTGKGTGKGKDAVIVEVEQQVAKGHSKGRTERLQWLRKTFAVRKSQGGTEAAKKWLGKQAGFVKL